jgi:hypothetical protein
LKEASVGWRIDMMIDAKTGLINGISQYRWIDVWAWFRNSSLIQHGLRIPCTSCFNLGWGTCECTLWLIGEQLLFVIQAWFVWSDMIFPSIRVASIFALYVHALCEDSEFGMPFWW